MTRISAGVRSAFLAILPSVTLTCGIALAGTGREAGWHSDPALQVALLVAVLAPLAAAGLMRLALPGSDLVLVACAGMLIAVGTSTLVFLAGAPGADGAFYAAMATRHGLFVGAGFLAFTVGAIAARNVDRITRYPFMLLTIALALTTATVIFGEMVNGARLWLQIGPARFQPSEVSRLLIAAFVAVYLYERRHLVAAPWRVGSLDLPPAPYLLPLAGAVLGAVVVLVAQNDLGMAALVVLGAFASVVGVIGLRAFVVIASIFLTGTVAGAFFAVSRVRDRVAGWFDPWQDPGGRGFQFVQAEYGLAAGEIVGDGVHVTARNVPEVHTDFILVGVASQLGWSVALALLALVGLLVCRCVLAALQAAGGFTSLLALSFAGLIGIQVVLIVGGSLRVLPLTGLTFPLVSYGGTSMIVTLFALGLIAGIGAESGTTPRAV